jgi:CheY-like chemotaxis protein
MTSPAEKQEATATPSRPSRILVVDDDPEVRAVVRASLIHLGYEVEDVPEAAAALAVLKDRAVDFDLLLTDVMMPRMDGITLLRRVRSFAPNLPVVLFSGHVTEEDLWLPDLHDVPLLTKPFSLATLCAVVRDALSTPRREGLPPGGA